MTHLLVPRPGVEPGRLAALVFETNASTNSAIWASLRAFTVEKCGAKVIQKNETTNFYEKKLYGRCTISKSVKITICRGFASEDFKSKPKR